MFHGFFSSFRCNGLSSLKAENFFHNFSANMPELAATTAPVSLHMALHRQDTFHRTKKFPSASCQNSVQALSLL